MNEVLTNDRHFEQERFRALFRNIIVANRLIKNAE